MASFPRIRSGGRSPSCTEQLLKRTTVAAKVSTDFDLQQVQEDLAKAKEQLGLLEKSKSSLAHDLARAKKNVDHLTIKVNNEVNEASKLRDKALRSPCAHAEMMLDVNHDHVISYTGTMILSAEEWKVRLDSMKKQYDAALFELQLNKQALGSLNYELLVCVEAKDEAVRLAGEAMNAAESTAKRVEELSIELFRTKIESATASAATGVDEELIRSNTGDSIGRSGAMEELLDELTVAKQNLMDANMACERISQEAAIESANREASLKDATESAARAMAEVEILKWELAEVKASSEAHLRDRTASLEASLCAAAKSEAEWKKALDVVVIDTQAQLEAALFEREEARKAEIVALGLLDKASKDLENAHGIALTMALQGSVLSSSLEFLKVRLEQTLVDALESQRREMNANAKIAELTATLAEMAERNQAEIMTLKERETSAVAKLYLLQAEVTESRWELQDQSSKYSSSSSLECKSAANWDTECGRCMFNPEQSNTDHKLAALVMELEENQVELQALKDQVCRNNRTTTALMCELEKKETELVDLHTRLLEMEVKARALTLGLSAKKERYLIELTAREVYDSCANFTDFGADVSELLNVLGEALKALATYNRQGNNANKTLDVTKIGHRSAAMAATNCKLEEAEIKVKGDGDEEGHLEVQKEIRMFCTSSVLSSSSKEGKAVVEELEKLRRELFEARAEAKDARAACSSSQSKLHKCLRELEALRSCGSLGDDVKKRRPAWSCMKSWIPLR